MPASCSRSTVVRSRIQRPVARIGRKEIERVVAPVVGQPARLEERLVDEGVDREQFQRRYAEPLEVRDHRRLGERSERPAQFWRNVAAQARQAPDVRFIDDGVLPGHQRPPLRSRRRRLRDHDRLRHDLSVVAPVEGQVLARAAVVKAVVQIARDELSGELLCVRIQEQLVGIEAMALLGLVRTMDAVAVVLAGADIGQIAVPDVIRPFRQRHTLALATTGVEQAELDLLRMRGEQREVGAAAVEGRPERIRHAGRNAHVSDPARGRSSPTAERRARR